MNPTKSRSWKFAIAVAALVVTMPALAQKRRAVQHPAPPTPAQSATISGKVVDAVTGLPVVSATVRVVDVSGRTDATGSFSITANIFGTADVTAERSGYNSATQQVSGIGPHVLTIQLQSKPTVKLRLVDGTQKDVDLESVEFGYVPPFSSYIKSESDDFCKPGGTEVRLNRVDFSRITGPSTIEPAGLCCGATGSAQRINATLKSGEVTPLYFSDSCTGYSVDFIARDHVTGRIVFTKFSDIAEIIFP